MRPVNDRAVVQGQFDAAGGAELARFELCYGRYFGDSLNVFLLANVPDEGLLAACGRHLSPGRLAEQLRGDCRLVFQHVVTGELSVHGG